MASQVFKLLKRRSTKYITYSGIAVIFILIFKVSSFFGVSVVRLISDNPYYLRCIYARSSCETEVEIKSSVIVENSNKSVVQSNGNTTTNHANGNMVHINPHNYNYIIVEKDVCTQYAPINISLVIGVVVEPHGFDRRNAIRETWGSIVSFDSQVRLIFVLGKANSSSSDIQAKINKESDMFHDIVQEDFEDSYENLSLKSIALLKWVTQFCQKALYVLKTDADIFINIPLLMNELTRRNYRNSVIGRTIHKARPHRDRTSKFFTPVEAFQDDFYPDYMAGCMYVLSGDIVPKLYQASLDIPLFLWEDVYVSGLCRSKMNVEAVNNVLFPKHEVNENCTFTEIAGGFEYSAKQLRYIWKRKNDGEEWSKSCYWFPPSHIWRKW